MTTKKRKATPETEDFGEKYTSQNHVNRYFVKKYFISIGKLLSNLSKNSIKNALEVGCGEGHSTKILNLLLDKRINFEASEFVSRQIPLARKLNPGLRIIQEDIYNLKRQSRSIDLVFALEVLEHLDYPEKALKELCRVSNKYVIIGVPNEPLWRILNMLRGKYLFQMGNTPGHLNHWSLKSLVKLVEKNGFEVVTKENPLPWNQILLKKKQYE